MKNRDATQVLEDYFLETRAKLLEVAATLDRIDRAASNHPLDQAAQGKQALLRQAIDILQKESGDESSRAAEIQQLFSRTYDPDWRSNLGMENDLQATTRS